MFTEEYQDQSQAHLPLTGGSIPKRERYQWASPSEMGEFRWIRKEALSLDIRYQRSQVSSAKVLDIARAFDWRVFGTLSVVERPDGALAVYDGGHRWRASCYRDDITLLPCMVFKAEDVAEEADAFLRTNLLKTGVSPYVKYRAALIAGEPTVVRTQSILDKYGFRVVNDSSSFGLRSIGAMLAIVKVNPKLADEVFAACVVIANKEHQPSAPLIRGLHYLAKNADGEALTPGNIQKLAEIGVPGIELAIRREKHLLGKGGEAIEGKALLDIINKGARNKLALKV